MPKLAIRPGGLNQFIPADGSPIIETHSSTCRHCQKLTEFPSLKRMFDHVDICRGCMSLICLGCVGKPCTPYELEAERQEHEFKLRHRLYLEAWGCYV
jgi:hypothetical protein